MDNRSQIIDIITAIRASFGASISVYTMGNCYQFYEILKAIFPKAEAYYDGGHVWTKIDDRFYDIRGELVSPHSGLVKIESKETIESLSVNKWTDERRLNNRII